MRLMILLLISLVLLVCTESNMDFAEEKYVLMLNEPDLVGALNQFRKLVVMFYSPNCDHCKKALPEFEKAAKTMYKMSTAIRFAKMDASDSKSLGEKYSFKTVPTIVYLYGENSFLTYRGARKAEDFVRWAKKKVGPVCDNITDESSLDLLNTETDVSVIGLFKTEDMKEAEVYKEVAGSIDNVPFGISTSKEMFEKFGIETDAAIVAMKKFDEGTVIFDGYWDVDDITKFVKRQRLPVVIEFSSKNADAVFSGETRRHVIFFEKKTAVHFLKHYMIFKTVATKFRYEFLFIFIDADLQENRRLTEFFKTTSADWPAVRAVGIDDEPSKVIKPNEQGFTEEIVMQFVQDVKDGKVSKKRIRKSQNEPSDWNAGLLKVLVGKTFYSRIKEKDAFVLFYAPNDHKSKQIMAAWSDLADEFFWHPTIMVGMIDGTENEIDKITLNEYPAIKFFPRGLNMVVDYKGAYSVEAFTKFLDRNTADGRRKPEELQKAEAAAAASGGSRDSDDTKDEL